jgi:Family of unknown function (DUF6011)
METMSQTESQISSQVTNEIQMDSEIKISGSLVSSESPIPFLGTHNATITLVNPATGNHRTFRVSTVKKGPLQGKRIVELLVGSNNEADYQGFGFVYEDGTIHTWRKYTGTVFQKYGDLLDRPVYWQNRGVQYMAEARCIKCSRKLTNPESLRTGVGPECAKKGF